MKQEAPPTRQSCGETPKTAKAVWFRMLALMVIPFVLLVCLEGILRVGGCGYSTNFFRVRQLEGREVWTDNPDFGRRFFPSGLVRRSQPFIVPTTKSSNTLRVLVLGESAAMGDPDFKFGLPRMLEVLMRNRFPDRRVEVINTAMVAINSHVILPIARDSVALRADLWVVYMGNNEMVGPFGSASIFGARAPALPIVRTGLWLKQTRLGELLDEGLTLVSRGSRRPPEWSGMDMMADQKVRYDSPATARVYSNFRQNLTQILTIAAKAKVPVVLCTVATNLKDCAPFASLHRRGLTGQQLSDWQAAYEAGSEWHKAEHWAEAKTAFQRAAAIDSDFAALSFQLGDCSRNLGQDVAAASFYQRARDTDGLQFRADSQINNAIRQAAQSFAGNGVELVDIERLFATSTAGGLTGAEHFYEHVHLTPEGNYLLAHAVAEAGARSLGLGEAQSWASWTECFRLVGLTDWNRYDALNTILDRIQRAPFTNQLNHQHELERVNEQLLRYRPGTKPAQARTEAIRVSEQVDRFPQDPDLRWNLAVLLQSSGDVAGAEKQWLALHQLQPYSPLPAYNLAKLLEGTGRKGEAVALYNEVLKLDPDNVLAREALQRNTDR